MFKMAILFFAFMVLSVPVADAKLFDNPETVSYLHAEIVREGSITLESTGFGAKATTLEIRHSAPQGTFRQSSELVSVTGADSHRFDEDDFGNEVVVLVWNNPPLDTKINYKMVFDVKVRDSEDTAKGLAFPTTGMIETTQEITQEAYELTGGKRAIEKFMALTSYVYSLVDYDKTYQNVQKSAKWVFENRKAVCDGHSNLLIAMLRALGYNAYYVIGYAYTEENLEPDEPVYWGPHGWVEVEYNGRAVSLDPTWGEHPVDATHIKFALAPDSNYTEFVQVMASNVEVNWEKGNYVVSMLDSEKRPRLDIEGSLIPDEAGSDEHSLFITEIQSSMDEPCVLTKLKLQPCTSNGDPFLTAMEDEKIVGFCTNKTLYWLLATPEIRRGMEYSCGVSVQGPGDRAADTLKAAARDDYIETRMSTTKVLTPSQVFQVNTTVGNTGLAPSDLKTFLFLDEAVKDKELSLEGMQEADIIWTLRAPKRPGTYPLRFFVSSGDLVEEDIVVIEKRSVEIADAPLPENMSIEDSLQLNITLRGLEDSRGELRLSVDNKDFSSKFIIDKGEEKAFAFVYSPESEGQKQVNIVVISDEEEYEDGLTAGFKVIRQGEWWEPIIAALRGFFEGLFRLLGMSE